MRCLYLLSFIHLPIVTGPGEQKIQNDEEQKYSSIPVENLSKFLPQRYSKQTKSEIMCNEYSKIFKKTEYVLPLSNYRPIPVVVSNSLRCEEQLSEKLISGGTPAKFGEFPHITALGWKKPNGEIFYMCAGSLVSNNWVLTSAHCTYGPYGSPNIVHIGSHILNDSLGEIIAVENIKRHPDYHPPETYADIALIKLKKQVLFGLAVRPACLHSRPRGISPSMKLWVTGWGATHYGGEPSKILLKAQLNIISNLDCSRFYNNSRSVPRGIAPSMLCAGDPSGGWKRDSCKFDSGSPLQNYHISSCLFEIVGITSFGKICAIARVPGVYTRVWFYIDWIEGIVWPGSD